LGVVRFLRTTPVAIILKIASEVSDLMQLKPSEIWAPGKERERVEARSLLCYWAVRGLGINMAKLARRLRLSLSGVSLSVKIGERIAQQNDYKLMEP
jgi:hypothetical protein